MTAVPLTSRLERRSQLSFISIPTFASLFRLLFLNAPFKVAALLTKEGLHTCWLDADPSPLHGALSVLADPHYGGDQFFANQGLQVIVSCLDADYDRQGPGRALACSDTLLGSVTSGHQGHDDDDADADPAGTWVLQAAMRVLSEATRQELHARGLDQQRQVDLAVGVAAVATAARAAGLGADVKLAANLAHSTKAGICQLVNLVTRVVGSDGVVAAVVR